MLDNSVFDDEALVSLLLEVLSLSSRAPEF